MSNKVKLFNESDQEEAEPVEFRTNKNYAKHYDQFRKKEILSQLKNAESEESSDSSDDETTDEEIVDPDFDKEFFRTLAFLKRNDPAKYAEQPKFFEKVKSVEEVALAKRHHKEKPMTLKDYERKMLLENGGVFEDEDDIDPNSERIQQRAASPTLVEQEKKIKDEIKQALSKIGESDSEDDGAEGSKARGGGLLKERSKNKDEREKDQADYIQWLADKKAQEPPSKELKDLEPLKHYWSKEKLSKEDAFLKDYILNKRFVEAGELPTYEDIVATSEDEEELEKQEEYERQYNFRFEEPDTEFIKRYPRTMEDSVRIERNKRKEERQALKERKQKEKEQKRRELEELKSVKLQEIKERIQRLKEIAATKNLAMNEDDLESDFDPEEHDRRMQDMFNDEYYGVDEGDQKPEFPDLDKELGIENYDKDRIDDDEEGDFAEPYCEDDDFVMDCDYEEKVKSRKEMLAQEMLDSTRSRKKKGRRQSKFREVLKAEKPLFDPEDEKTYGEYIDEYYKLDYEDMIGDVPCRFKYVETVPNDFGLSIAEILAANTRELNRWASVKKTVQLRPKQTELTEVEAYRRRGQNESLKRKLLPSLFTETDINEEEDTEIKVRKHDLVPKSEDNAETSEGKSAKAAEESKQGKKIKDKVSFTETDNVTVEPVKKEKKKNKQDSSVDDANVHENNSANGKGSAQQPKTSSDARHASQQQASGGNFESGNGPGHNKKRTWNQANGTSAASHRNTNSWSGPQQGRFAPNGRPHGKPHIYGRAPQGSYQDESASDQRLRAFGLNPRKYHNKQKYGNQQQKNRNGIGQNKSFNKKTRFE
ncbi:protein KRI1 homolog [Anopheles ziemanni]|uniref:protein KRI1 homolog n=1 Tax=Anopheles coustani TaxID=139045 RepID=UPI002659281C|nr:protein KRI1 homolog [Anopheles coustani]XP_058178313.1 protein KRI1 homolog [Anopheles ziemanni]